MSEEIEPDTRYAGLQFSTRQQMRLEIARLSAELEAALRDADTYRPLYEAAERRCAEMGRAVKAKDAAMQEAQEAFVELWGVASGAEERFIDDLEALQWVDNFARKHDDKLQAALAPTPQIAGEATAGTLDADIKWVREDRDRWERACQNNTAKLRVAQKRIAEAVSIGRSGGYDGHWETIPGQMLMALDPIDPPAPAPSAAEGKPSKETR